MIKYIPQDSSVVFAEIPDEITLAINISNCQNNCIGCHSAYLKQNIGSLLDFKAVDELIKGNDGITCFCFMGEGNDKETLLSLAKYIRENHSSLKVGIYSGRENVEDDYNAYFDYIKIGPYIERFGPLNKETTNQRLYQIVDNKRIDITYKFWKKPLAQ